MKKYTGVFWLIGLCAFLALMCSGFAWLLGVLKVSWSLLGTIRYVCHIVLIVIALVSGWLWISSAKMNAKVKIVLQVFFVIFAIMAILGVCGVGL